MKQKIGKHCHNNSSVTLLCSNILYTISFESLLRMSWVTWRKYQKKEWEKEKNKKKKKIHTGLIPLQEKKIKEKKINGNNNDDDNNSNNNNNLDQNK